MKPSARTTACEVVVMNACQADYGSKFLRLLAVAVTALGFAVLVACGGSAEAETASAGVASEPPAAAAPGASGGGDTRDEGVRREGPPAAHIALNDSGTKVTVDACQSGCRDHAECKSWSWKQSMIEADKGLCYFSKVVGDQHPDPRSVSGVIGSKL